MSVQLALLRLILAALFGAIIGYEREVIHKPAGLRTMMLVSLGSCLFTLASLEVARSAPGADPARIAAQVVTGVGFLGAGSILRAGTSVVGVTTAACIWLVAAVGLATGLGLYWHALSTSLIGFVILRLLERLIERGKRRRALEGQLPGNEE
ncbi:MAG: MgtC/SapB family protein [candidate division KSB1 bacterium]|nr:MgtC/SapB family protein [candidate division KSB1 bacterium]